MMATMVDDIKDIMGGGDVGVWVWVGVGGWVGVWMSE